MNNLDRYADTMLGQINQCISQQLESTPAIRSAIVKNVNTDGTVDVIIPPNDTSVFTKITNQTPFTLNEGDSVELLLKSGNLNNCWVIAKHNAEQTTAWTDMRSHVGMIIQSTTLDSEAKVIQLYGGKHWTRLDNMFLIGAGDLYDINATGGETEHVLTEEEMPQHRHWISGAAYDDGNMSSSGSSNTQDYGLAADASSYTQYDLMKPYGRYDAYTGGNLSHNNMPPYRAVYMWERTQ